jgi:hypothetical protein
LQFHLLPEALDSLIESMHPLSEHLRSMMTAHTLQARAADRLKELAVSFSLQ